MEHIDKQNIVDQVKSWYRGLPEKKRYVELITAVLTVPVLITVLLANIQNIKHKPQQDTPSPSGSTAAVIQYIMPSGQPTPTVIASMPTPTPLSACKKEIGPVEITSPKNGQAVSSDPVLVEVTRSSDAYCGVVWSYRINDGPWSDYTDNSIYLYGLSSGSKVLEVRIKSIVSSSEVILSHTFIVVANSSPTPQSTESASVQE